MEWLKVQVRNLQSLNLWFAFIVSSQEIFKSQVISKIAKGIILIQQLAIFLP